MEGKYNRESLAPCAEEAYEKLPAGNYSGGSLSCIRKELMEDIHALQERLGEKGWNRSVAECYT